MNNLEKAHAFFENGFWAAGQGHFDINEIELAEIFDLLDAGDIDGLKKIYEDLSELKCCHKEWHL